MSTIARFSLQEYDRLIASGVFDFPQRRHVELIRGELREMTPPGPSHEDAVDFLTKWSVLSTAGEKVRIRVQNSIGIAPLASAPEPDIAWVREKKGYKKARPAKGDVLLLIEVSDSSLDDDRGTKAKLYATAGIKDYWIVNLQDHCVEVRRDPWRGRYRALQTFTAGEEVRPLVLPKIALSVSELFSS
ncbi:MAG TPA: Uma2 family endonuclease [Pirellulales bacterium]|nr:Uma2 family endonuclease [Pirellulales bacterium]